MCDLTFSVHLNTEAEEKLSLLYRGNKLLPVEKILQVGKNFSQLRFETSQSFESQQFANCSHSLMPIVY